MGSFSHPGDLGEIEECGKWMLDDQMRYMCMGSPDQLDDRSPGIKRGVRERARLPG